MQISMTLIQYTKYLNFLIFYFSPQLCKESGKVVTLFLNFFLIT